MFTQKAYEQTESGKKTRQAARIKYEKNHPEKKAVKLARYQLKYPEKEKAHNAISNAIRDGIIRRSVFCEVCGLPAITQAHHSDYSELLSVLWACQICHTKIHTR